jgi:hypothetical protein
MRWSTLFIPTLREPQAHQLLERAGYIRQVSSGSFAYLPLAQRSLLKIQRIVRAEMSAIGGQEIRLPLSTGRSPEEIVTAIAKANYAATSGCHKSGTRSRPARRILLYLARTPAVSRLRIAACATFAAWNRAPSKRAW